MKMLPNTMLDPETGASDNSSKLKADYEKLQFEKFQSEKLLKTQVSKLQQKLNTQSDLHTSQVQKLEHEIVKLKCKKSLIYK